MPLGFQGSEWLYQNTVRHYPLAPHAEPTDITKSFTLPDDLLVELYLPIAYSINANPAKFFIRTIVSYVSGITITIGYDGGTLGQFDVATAIVSYSAVTEFTPIVLAGTDAFSATTGRLVIGRIANILKQPSGSFSFAPDATPLDVDCIRPSLQSVSGITIQDGAGTLFTMTGIVQLTAGSNTVISVVDNQTIRIDAVEGAGLNQACSCTDLGTTPTPITSINGVTADPTGAITITGDSCLTINPIANGFQITDSCSNPCCGCAELEAITGELQNFASVATTLGNFTSQLQGQVAQMTQVVIGSQLGDNGCITCS